MKSLSRKERIGAVTLAAITVVFVSGSFMLRRCDLTNATPADDPVSEAVVIYSDNEAVTDSEDDYTDDRLRKKSHTKSDRKKKKKRKSKDRRRRSEESDTVFMRDFLNEPVTVMHR